MSATPEIETRTEQPYAAIRAKVSMAGISAFAARTGEVFGYLTDPSEEPDMSKWQTQLAFRLAG